MPAKLLKEFNYFFDLLRRIRTTTTKTIIKAVVIMPIITVVSVITGSLITSCLGLFVLAGTVVVVAGAILAGLAETEVSGAPVGWF